MSLLSCVRWCTLLVLLLGLTPPANAQSSAELPLRLRRASFDPLRQPQSRRQASQTPSELRIVQLAIPAGAQAEAQLRAAGAEPLAYIPDQAYLVRWPASNRRAFATMRWEGALLPLDKQAPELDAAAASTASVDVRVLLLSQDSSSIRRALATLNASVVQEQAGAFGLKLEVRLPGTSIVALLARDDVLWIEPAATPRLLNDQSHSLLQVEQARAALPWLTGRGQIVAVADTGLDIQAQVQSGSNPDFLPGRIVRASNLCESGASWTDLAGHGTHVAGSVLGSGARSNGQFAGIAPEASLVVQSLSLSASKNDLCLDPQVLLADAYNAGARILNASWGYNTMLGVYDSTANDIDRFVWEHPQFLFVVAAGNSGVDCLPLQNGNACGRDGVIDPGSINTPATAKNVLSVGATELARPDRSGTWGASLAVGEPIASDPTSNNVDGMAAFSSRGPTNDGRLKPEIVAPGVAVISAVSHAASYPEGYYAGAGLNYAYSSGTSMSAPMVSGAAALVRQWLAQQRGMATPSAALVKAMLMNGASNITPGQYGEGAQREIPASWPNSVEGWGRANVASAVGLGETPLLVDHTAGLSDGQQASYSIPLAARQTIRITLAWSDNWQVFPGAARTLVNNLDLVLLDAGGAVVARGNQQAGVPSACWDGSADMCNNAEAVEFTAPASGNYTVRVASHAIPKGPQPFALVASSPAPALAPEPLALTNAIGSPNVAVNWATLPGATRYELRFGPNGGASSTQTLATNAALFVAGRGSFAAQVRGCNANGCGPWSAQQVVQVNTSASNSFTPWVRR